MGEFIAISILFFVGLWSMPQKFKHYPTLRRNFYLGMVFRLIGTITYFIYAYNFTGGNVDAFVYYTKASEFTKYFVKGDFSPLTNEALWRNGSFFYTNFVSYPASFFQIITFDSRFAIYLLFSLVCFVGLVLMLNRFIVTYRFCDYNKLSFFVLLFPAVWFWTSTIGKDAFVFLGIGIIVSGLHLGRINFLKLAIGLFIIYAFRPPVAVIVGFSIASVFLFSFRDNWFIGTIKLISGLLIFLYITNYVSTSWGLEVFDPQNIAEFQTSVLRNNDYGVAALEEKTGGFASIPRGILDILFRPFIWEVKNVGMLFSSFEIMLMIGLLIVNFNSVLQFIKNSLNNNLSKFTLSFILIYVISTGLVENNIGLIARHRSVLFPFLILMCFAYSSKVYRSYIIKNKLKYRAKPQELLHAK